MEVVLNQDEIDYLFRPISGQGGFQGLLKRLRVRLDKNSGKLTLTKGDLERIPRYAFEYGNGGWEGRLRGIFGRHLGPDLLL
jgi:hypothetical protein